MPVVQITNISSTYKEHVDALYAYALHMGFDEQTAMDAIHDLFYKLCLRQTSIDDLENLRFYLIRSLRNRLIDIRRSQREFAILDNDEQESIGELPFHLEVTVEDEMIMEEEKEEIRKKIEKVLSSLTHRQREIIFLRYINEYSYEEIAAIMQISVESSRNLLSRTIARLKDSPLPVRIILLFLC
jgi:RNA polymerase sigma factor (sigma-70 family)